MVQWFVGFCPLQCKGKRLCSTQSEDDTRWKLSQHLQFSPTHNMTADEADAMAATAELVTEDYEEQPEEQHVHAARSEPYKGGGKSKGKAKGYQIVASSAPSSSSAGPAATQVQVAAVRLENQAQRALKAAKAAAMMSRQAALAFDEEASNLRDVLDELQKQR